MVEDYTKSLGSNGHGGKFVTNDYGYKPPSKEEIKKAIIDSRPSWFETTTRNVCKSMIDIMTQCSKVIDNPPCDFCGEINCTKDFEKCAETIIGKSRKYQDNTLTIKSVILEISFARLIDEYQEKIEELDDLIQLKKDYIALKGEYETKKDEYNNIKVE